MTGRITETVIETEDTIGGVFQMDRIQSQLTRQVNKGHLFLLVIPYRTALLNESSMAHQVPVTRAR